MMDSRIAYDDFGGGGNPMQAQQRQGGLGDVLRRLIAQKLAGQQGNPGMAVPREHDMRMREPNLGMPRIIRDDPTRGMGGFTGGLMPDQMQAPVMEMPQEPTPAPMPARVFRPRPELRNRRFGGPSSMEY